MILAVDFDQTVAVSDFPTILCPVPGARQVLRDLCAGGRWELVLHTCRTGSQLAAAVDWWTAQGFPPLLGVNKSRMPEGLPPDACEGPKPYADFYVDDKALGCPLTRYMDRDVVWWSAVHSLLGARMQAHKIVPVIFRREALAGTALADPANQI